MDDDVTIETTEQFCTLSLALDRLSMQAMADCRYRDIVKSLSFGSFSNLAIGTMRGSMQEHFHLRDRISLGEVRRMLQRLQDSVPDTAECKPMALFFLGRMEENIEIAFDIAVNGKAVPEIPAPRPPPTFQEREPPKATFWQRLLGGGDGEHTR